MMRVDLAFYLLSAACGRQTLSLLMCLVILSSSVTNGLKLYSKRSIAYSADSIESKFDIHPNTIILTLESRSMGAKYINETEVSSNEECLMWCWQQPTCNVVVFEEMTRRSCFLFNCGSPADFRCKFTGHNFYTSSFLKTTQHSYDLKQWSQEAKEEKELAEKQAALRMPASTPPPMVTSSVAVLNSPVSTLSNVEQTRPAEASRCRRYQFQCLNSSECIAIYNVCDGIPQCPDGSDESSELQCPYASMNRTHALHLHVNEGGEKTAIVPDPKLQLAATKQSSVQAPQLPPVQSSPPNKAHVPQHVIDEHPLLPTPPPTVQQQQQSLLLPAHAKPEPPPANRHQLRPHQHAGSGESEHSLRGMADAAAMYREGYGGPKSSQGMYYDAPVDDSLHSPFSHRHSKFLAANDPRFQYQARWPDDYERYPQKLSSSAAAVDQQYSSLESGYPQASENYQRPRDSFPKNQYPDYDRTVYDTYHPEENPAYSDQDQLPSTSYLSNDYPQVNLPSPNQQSSYPSHSEAFESHQVVPQKPLQNDEYGQMDRPVVKQVHRAHNPHETKMLTDQDNYMVPENARPQPYVPYGDMPRTDYRMMPEMRAQDMNLPSPRVASDMYNRDEAIRKSLSQQLQSLHKEPLHMADHFPASPLHSTPPAVVRQKSGGHATQEKAEVHPVAHPSKQRAHPQNHKSHGTLSTTTSDGIVAGKLTADHKSPDVQVAAHPHEGNNTVIALAMGLAITALLIFLVGCRLRTLRRKTIRRGRNLTHDADYLVNGLYL